MWQLNENSKEVSSQSSYALQESRASILTFENSLKHRFTSKIFSRMEQGPRDVVI